MKVIEKHYNNNNINETGKVVLYPHDSNILLTKKIKYIAFNATKEIGYKFSKNEPLKMNKTFSIRDDKEEFYLSNNTKEEITVKYSCSH